MKSTTVTKLLSIGTLTLAVAGNILGNILAKRQLKEAVAEEDGKTRRQTGSSVPTDV